MVKIRRGARSLFATKTFRIGLVAFIGAATPIIIPCLYTRRAPNSDEAVTLASALIAFITLLVGRVETSPVYTPEGLPGPNKSDYK